jgi:hypothetical protein
MGLFKKKEKKVKQKEVPSTLPELPNLPELPKIGKEKIDDSLRPIPQLPSFPSNSLGEKFSQDTIKRSVTGKKEGEEVLGANDFAEMEDEIRMMQKPQKKSLTKEIYPLKKGGKILPAMAEKAEPVFIRVDKFEEILNITEKTKKQILEIEKMLMNITKIKEEEERELNFWEKEIQTIKRQIEKVDQNISSKIE